jgi:hypothetical protein
MPDIITNPVNITSSSDPALPGSFTQPGELNLQPTTLNFNNTPSIPGSVDITVPNPITQVDTTLDPALSQNFNAQGGYASTVFDPINPNAGLQGAIEKARSEGDSQNKNFGNGDWRVRISLAESAQYLYNAPDDKNSGILKPLSATGGVVFPYTPTVQINYQASYDPTMITHSNYKIFQYQGSGIESVTITGQFTAQDVKEASYLLAVIHFFRTVTKMFYGQDQYPKAGTPPPLCFLHGLGAYQFDNHPMVISSFNYTLPDDVDYIRAGTVVPASPGKSTAGQQSKQDNNGNLNALVKVGRLIQNLSQFKIGLGGEPEPPTFVQPDSYQVQEPTYIPTRIQIAVTALPVVSRNDISNTFSLQKYGSGELLRGSKRGGGGIW